MSGDVTYQGLRRLTWMPDREQDENGLVIAAQYYYDVEFTGGNLSNVNLTNVTINGTETARNLRVVTDSGDVTVSPSDYIIVIDKDTPEPTTVFLPDSPVAKRSLIIKKEGDNELVTIDGNGLNIDGVASFTLNIPYDSAEIVFNGEQWNAISTTTTGYVQGAASASNNSLIRFDGSTGRLIKDSTVTVSDTGDLAATTIYADEVRGEWLGDVIDTAHGGTGMDSYDTGDILYCGGSSNLNALPIGDEGQVLAVSSGGVPEWITVSGVGTVTSVSVVNANGFNGSVENSTTTPAITIGTTVTGILKGNGTAISSASQGVDYVSPETLPLNVLDFGAFGDGVADDTSPFQDMFDVAMATGRSMFVPAGNYSISNVVYNKAFTLYGEGWKSCIIPQSGMVAFSADPACDDMRGTSISYLQFSGADNGNTAFVGRTNSSNRSIIFKECLFLQLKDWAIRISDSYNCGFYDCDFRSNGDRVNNIGGGIQMFNSNWTSVSTGNLISNCHFTGHDVGIGMSKGALDNIFKLRVESSVFEYNNYGIDLVRSTVCEVDSCYAEANYIRFIRASSITAINCSQNIPTQDTTDGIEVTGVLVEPPSRRGIRVLSASPNRTILDVDTTETQRRVNTLYANSGAISILGSAVFSGSGDPNGSLSANRGAIRLGNTSSLREDALYVKAFGGSPSTNGWLPVMLRNHGTTANRPSIGSTGIGYQYFDTTLGKPIWWDGTGWVDATGASV